MAQVKKKRQTKHRGNAAGMVESRGRTGRKPTSAEKKGAKATAKKQPGVDRRDMPPSWKKAFLGALFAAVMLFLIMAVAFKKPAQGAILFPFVLLMYIPISYYTDNFFYKRRLSQQARGKAR
jgi:drug/metabolite transporter (DMT)-like permease